MDSARTRYEAWSREIERERASRLGRADDTAPDDARLGEIDRRFEDVTSGEAIERVREDLEQSTLGGEREQRRRLLVALEDAVLTANRREVRTPVRARQHALRVRTTGAPISLAAARRTLARERDPETRARLLDSIDEQERELDELREEAFAAEGEALTKLGFDCGSARLAAIRPGVDLEMWLQRADTLLEATAARWSDTLDAGLAQVRGGRRARHDLPAAVRVGGFDATFAAKALGPSVGLLTSGLGAELANAPGTSLSPGPRTGCALPRVPGEVIVRIALASGLAPLRQALRTAGVALHASHTSSALPSERARVGDFALRSGFAALLANRAHDPGFVSQLPGAARGGEPGPAIALPHLLEVRTSAARLHFECALAATPAGESPHRCRDTFTEQMQAATGLAWSPAGYLRDAGPVPRALDELRAACFEAQLAEDFRHRFGRRFWCERDCGNLLKELWNTGMDYTVEELASDLGLGPLEIEPLIATLVDSAG